MNSEVDFYIKSRRKYIKLKPEKQKGLSCHKALLMFEKFWIILTIGVMVVAGISFAGITFFESYVSTSKNWLSTLAYASFITFIIFCGIIYLINEVKIYSKVKRKSKQAQTKLL